MTQLAEIEKLLDAKFLHSRAGMNAILERERQLREGLSKLVDMDNHPPKAGDDQMRAIGADVVWRAWVGRTKTKLNLELAQVLAQKEVMLRDVRKDFGKLAVCQKLKQMELKNSKMTAQKKALAVSIQSNLFSNGKRK